MLVMPSFIFLINCIEELLVEKDLYSTMWGQQIGERK
jgi:hypothetical protein